MYGGPNQFNMIESARMGNDQSTPADSFQGGIEDLEAALMEGMTPQIDELQLRNQQANQGGENEQMMMLMQMLGGMG